MSGKKQKIIQAAMQAFLEKGYRGTSIQDIADMLGIAKGSLYFYFKSKEELLLSILKHHLQTVMDDYEQLNNRTDLTPQQLLHDNIVLSYRLYDKHRTFFSLLMQERFEVNDEIHELLVQTRHRSLFNTYQTMVRVYGEDIEPFACDAAIIFQSVVDGYLSFTVMENKKFDEELLADFVTERMDRIIKDLCGTKQMLIGKLDLEEWGKSVRSSKFDKADALSEIEQLRELLIGPGIADDERTELRSTLDVLASELEKDEPQPVVIKGMLTLIKMSKFPALKKQIGKLDALLEDLL